MGFNGTGLSGMSLSNMGLYVSVFKVDVGCFFSARTFSSRFRGFARPCLFLFFVLLTLGIFIGGASLEGVILFNISFTHSFATEEKSDNQLNEEKG